jgi:RNA polymerase sigma-70 factor (ECF subfamily)
VLDAARPDSGPGQEAFTQLYSDYWRPLYAYVRRRGFAAEEAEDITQDFFARILEKQVLSTLERAGGRFRSFLLGAMNHFLANEWDYARAQKRGGGRKPLSLDAVNEEGNYVGFDVTAPETPESLFEKRWVLTLLNHVMDRLRDEQAAAEKAALFHDLRAHLKGDRSGASYAELGLKHGLTEGAIKVTVHRLRRRYGLILREEIARTVSTPAEVDEELRHLIQVISA